MTESAAKVVNVPESPIPPRQLREFDSRLLQQLPDLTKEEMQHLIEHPEEMRARLGSYGLKNIDRLSPINFVFNEERSRFSWKSFYADVFGVAPDFSRLYFPDTQICTYTTPVFVAPKLELRKIIAALEQFGVETRGGEQFCTPNTKDLRPEENYVASLSSTIIEDCPMQKKPSEEYCSRRTTLREYLLWTLHWFYCKKWKGQSEAHDFDRLLSPQTYNMYIGCYGTRGGSSEQLSPFAHLFHSEGKLCIEFLQSGVCARHGGVHQVKLWKSLPQM